MKDLDQIKTRLKSELPIEGISHVIKSLKGLLPEDSAVYNLLVNLDSDYRILKFDTIEGKLSNEEIQRANNVIRSRLLKLIDELSPDDFDSHKLSSNLSEEKTYRKGHVLYQIPSKMQQGEETRCIVRIAFEKMLLIEDMDIDEDTKIKSEVRVSDHMKVEIIDPSNKGAFEIRSTSQQVQFVDKDDFSEWRFYVKPLLEGEHVLELKVSVIVIINGKEIHREKTLEESVTIVTEVVEHDETSFVRAEEDMIIADALATTDAVAPVVAASRQAPGRPDKTSWPGIGAMAGVLVLCWFGSSLFFSSDSKNTTAETVTQIPAPPTEITIEEKEKREMKQNQHRMQIAMNEPASTQDKVSEPAKNKPSPVKKANEKKANVKKANEKKANENAKPALDKAAKERARAEAERKAMEEHKREDELAKLKKQIEDQIKNPTGTGSGGQSNSGGDPNTSADPVDYPNNTSGSASTITPFVIGFGNRTFVYPEAISEHVEETGIVNIKICVDGFGKVLFAEPKLAGSTTQSQTLQQLSIANAKQFIFETSEIDQQCGTITYSFRMQ